MTPSNSSDSDSDDDDGIDDGFGPHGPNFLTRVETFNAPLNVMVMHDPSATLANFQMVAANNLGNTRVTLDSSYAGTFDVSTMFAQADVLTWDGTDFDANYDDDGDSDSDDDGDDDDSSSNSTLSSRAIADNDRPVNLSAKKGKVRMYLPSFEATTTTTTAEASSTSGAGRCLEYDLISSSEIRGWVGTPPRPPSNGPRDNQSHVDVMSSLSGAQLVLQP